MATSMTPSGKTITDDQIEKGLAQVRAAFIKHRSEIPCDAAQAALGTDNLGMSMFAVFRARVEAIAKEIVRIVTVDRARSQQQALNATGRKQYTDKGVVATMPRGEGDEVTLIYFKPDESAYKDGYLSCAALEAEYEKRGLVPDPMAQIDDNGANPEFADKTPNACQWKDKDGNYCYVAFGRWSDERDVYVRRRGSDWLGSWVFAGVRKESSASAV